MVQWKRKDLNKKQEKNLSISCDFERKYIQFPCELVEFFVLCLTWDWKKREEKTKRIQNPVMINNNEEWVVYLIIILSCFQSGLTVELLQ